MRYLQVDRNVQIHIEDPQREELLNIIRRSALAAQLLGGIFLRQRVFEDVAFFNEYPAVFVYLAIIPELFVERDVEVSSVENRDDRQQMTLI